MGGKHGSVFPTFLLSSGRWILCRFKALPCAFPGFSHEMLVNHPNFRWLQYLDGMKKAPFSMGKTRRNQISWWFPGVSHHFSGTKPTDLPGTDLTEELLGGGSLQRCGSSGIPLGR